MKGQINKHINKYKTISGCKYALTNQSSYLWHWHIQSWHSEAAAVSPPQSFRSSSASKNRPDTGSLRGGIRQKLSAGNPVKKTRQQQYSAPPVRNSLPSLVTNSDSITTFKSQTL